MPVSFFVTTVMRSDFSPAALQRTTIPVFILSRNLSASSLSATDYEKKRADAHGRGTQVSEAKLKAAGISED
ncbi:hypothetical protein QUF72_11135 [Desulfobacterales bacterium HSG2]|nr:hypothetical protein [Desulfobacterales bacterium HSG2]